MKPKNSCDNSASQTNTQTPEQRRENFQSLTIDDDQAKELAIQLGLAS